MTLRFPSPSAVLWTLLLTLTVLLSSCGFGRMATGVVVWAPDGGSVRNGDVVWVWEQSRIRKSLKIEKPSGGGAFEVDQWRVKTFPGDGEANEFLKTFGALKDTWAISGKQGLPVREAADAGANRIYKLGENEEVKVLAGNGPRVKQGNLEGSWVQILTKDGYSGWVFDYYLTLVVHGGGGTQQVKASGPGDQMVQSVLAQQWFPEEMRLMIEQDRVNLVLFRADAGLRASASPPSFGLVLPLPDGTEERLDLAVGDAKKISDSTYDFGGPAGVKVQFTNAEGSRMNLSFTSGGKPRTIPLTLLDDNVGNAVNRELASRQQKLAELTGRGKTLVSPTYGTIRLTAEGAFTWEGAGEALGGQEGGKGVVAFDWYKDKRIMGEFRALRFQFGEDPLKSPSKVFLYRFLKDGLQLLPAADTDLDPVRQTVTAESKSGLSLFFTFQD